MANIIELHDLTKYYGKHRGIENLSFNVEEGEIFGFIGPNGAGKSTTIRTLLALIFPTSGSATVFGKDCIRDAKEIAQQIGYLPSEIFYYDGMKVMDLLAYAQRFYKKDCTTRIKELAKRLDLDLSRKIEDLSYGNKKKVGIIQGLLHSPKLVFLDEPTGGLDPLMQQTFFELLREENSKGVTIFFSSHILSEVQRMCARVAILKDGSLIQLQKISDLRSNNYKRIELLSENALDSGAVNGLDATDIKVSSDGMRFLYKGDIHPLLQQMSALPLRDISIQEPTLEEIFLHYYE